MSAPSTAAEAERAVRQLELTVARRLDGLLQGDHRGLLPGPGSEPGEGRPYVPGDDVRHIDWNLTARSTVPHVRDRVADRELQTWLVVDGSASLDFGTATQEKRDLATAVAAAFGFLTARGGNRVGAVVATPDGDHVVPPRSGRDAVRAIVLALHRRDRATPGRVDLAASLRRVGHLARRRGLVVVVSDLLDQPDPAPALRALRLRHDVTVAEVRDPREDALPGVGLLTLVDPETGRRVEVQTDRADLRARFAAAATDRRTATTRAVRAAGAAHLVCSTDRDWLLDVLRHVASRRTLR